MILLANPQDIIDSRGSPQFKGFSVGVLIIFCVMYQVYFYGMSEEEGFHGPGWQRSALKLLGLTCLYLSISKIFSVQALLRKFIIKAPIIFIAIVTIFVSPFLDSFELQALNMCLFVPILAIDFNKAKGDHLFNHFFNMLVIILIIQFVLDPVLKIISGVGYVNWAVIGGVGNANSFGYLLLCGAIYCLVCLRKTTMFYLLCAASLFTGSLMVLICAIAIAFLNAIINFRKIKLFNLAFVTIVIMAFFAVADNFFYNDLERFLRSVNHSFSKFLSLLNFIEGAQVGSASITIREEYFNKGLKLIMDNPWSLLIGHPERTPMYTGDGWWLSLLVTHGLVLTVFFLVCNVYAFFRGLKLRSSEGQFCALIILLTCVVFLGNRLLDYWPAAIPYFFALSYVCNQRITSPT